MSLPIYKTHFHSPIGLLTLVLQQNQLIAIQLPSTNMNQSLHTTNEIDASALLPIQRELAAYFADSNHHFSIPLQLTGTPFQKKVWQALTKIPKGKTISYGELAARLNTSARAIGNACCHNPLPIIIPCHRVVAKHHIGGYSGDTEGSLIKIKQWLLRHESL